MLTVGSLFAGIGGLELGLERAGMVTRWQVERDDYCRRVLAKHWPDVARFEDVRDVGAHNLPPVDVICGGFPCQDVSQANTAGLGLDGARSGLWSEYARIVREVRPRFVVVENVAALLGRGMGRVLRDLADIGYDAEWSVLSACAVGAPHPRERVFIVAHAPELRLPCALNDPRGDATPRRSAGWLPMPGDSGAAVRNVERWQVRAPEFLRTPNGVPARVDRIAALGNAVVPQVAEYIGRLIVAADAESRGECAA